MTEPAEKITQFQKSLDEKNSALIDSEFRTNEKENYVLFHYTKPDTAKVIIDSGQFQASFIRSTSDSLEFAGPMTACRDWLCFKKELIHFPNFPTQLFCHFNEQAIDPYARPYFISLSEDSNSELLKEAYGEACVQFTFARPTKETPVDIFSCKYPKNIKDEVFRLLNRWRNEVFFPAIEECNFENPDKNWAWFYSLMSFCNFISTGIKEPAFEWEKEQRLIIYPNFSISQAKWWSVRGQKPISERSLLVREFLLINIESLGIKISV